MLEPRMVLGPGRMRGRYYPSEARTLRDPRTEEMKGSRGHLVLGLHPRAQETSLPPTLHSGQGDAPTVLYFLLSPEWPQSPLSRFS